MALSLGYVSKLYENLSIGRRSVFFDSFADDVQWTVMGHTRWLVYITVKLTF
jgi:hypothetical protein